MEQANSEASKGRKNSKKPRFRDSSNMDDITFVDKNHDVKSYRIHGNPNGYGFAVEEVVYKAGERRSDAGRHDINGYNAVNIETDEHQRMKHKKIEAKRKAK